MLNDKHRRELASSGLSEETIDISGCFSASGTEARDLLGFDPGPGLAFPYPGTENNGSAPYTRVKPDHPFGGNGGAAGKYVSPKREKNPAGNRLYVPPNLPDDALDDSSVPLIITEGEKKALAGNQEGFPTIGLAGVACWVSKNGDGESHAIADLDLITWAGRLVYVVFDSDASTKIEVKREEGKLARELRRRGADVRIARLPKPRKSEDQEFGLAGKFGMDDFLKVRGRAAFGGLLGRAKEPRIDEAARKRPTADLAEDFLAGLDGPLLWWRDEFYRYTGTHYERWPEADLRAQADAWLQSMPDRRGAAGTRVTVAILQNIKAITRVDSTFEPPVWLDGRESQQEYVVLENGVIGVNDLLRGNLDVLESHTSSLFSLAALPFPLDPEADCPRWLAFLEQMLPEPDLRQLVQEMFGYLLVHDVSQEKFFLFEGTGANGKTVVCTVLREILGDANVSGVNLEAFSATRTFPLAATIGRRANIVEELDEITKAAEGTLKNFVTGKPMTIERKNKDAFEFTPTARLVFATNILPRFVDRTDGLWRRMVLIPFRERLLDETKQDKNLIDGKWWRESGELPAIFLWAIGGLAQLRQRGRFIEPEASRLEKASYRRDSNPAGSFLMDSCAAEEGHETASKVLYQAYRVWAEDHGFRPLSATPFSKEVHRAFPQVTLTKNPRHWEGGGRSRLWIGLRFDGGM